MFEPDAARRAELPGDCVARLGRLARGGLLPEPADTIAARVTLGLSLAEAVADTTHVQECGPEAQTSSAVCSSRSRRLLPRQL